MKIRIPDEYKLEIYGCLPLVISIDTRRELLRLLDLMPKAVLFQPNPRFGLKRWHIGFPNSAVAISPKRKFHKKSSIITTCFYINRTVVERLIRNKFFIRKKVKSSYTDEKFCDMYVQKYPSENVKKDIAIWWARERKLRRDNSRNKS